jgi:hypothetical protein
MSKKFNIGIDFGGVLSIHDDIMTNITGSEHRNTSINMPFAIDSIKYLKEQGNNLYLISFCGKTRALETRASMKNNNELKFFDELYFVKTKPYKNELCSYLGCHFMIDDNVEILDNIKSNNNKIITILFDKEEHPNHKCAKDWQEVIKIINGTEYFDIEKSDVNISKLLYQ